MKGKFILFHGSASLSCPSDRLDKAIEFVRCLVSEILSREGGVAVLAGDEQGTRDDEGNPHIFDWIVLREVLRYVESTIDPQRKCVYVVMSNTAWQSKIEAANQKVFSTLQQRGVVDVKRIRAEEYTGGEYRSAQVQYADGMVALGGGKGTYTCGQEMAGLGKPVLPLDIEIGAFSEDGRGALGLLKEFTDSPERFFPRTHEDLVGRIETLSLQSESNSPSVVAQRAAELFQREFAASSSFGLELVKSRASSVWDWVQSLARVAGIVRAVEILRGFFP
ncbi:MAG: hypothetical protein OXI16_13335 [Chloroflexota bacterium]|nr:hypothetical protein [Chloroflexota bacterium]